MDLHVICESRDKCGDTHCSYRRATRGTTVEGGYCGIMSDRVNIVHADKDKLDPNLQFWRKKNGY